MTAPLRSSEPLMVNVPLGERAYDIVIGRGVLASLGQRLAALRPQVRAAIVTAITGLPRWVGALRRRIRGRRGRREDLGFCPQSPS